MINTAVILAGGLGLRLRSIEPDVPKVMVPVAGRPFIDRQIDFLRKSGITKFILCIGYRHDLIVSHIGNGAQGRVEFIYSIEEELMGTGGAIKAAASYLPETFIVINGDTYIDQDVRELEHVHIKQKAILTITTTKTADISAYGIVEIDRHGSAISFNEKDRKRTRPGLINAGMYVMSNAVLDYIPESNVVSLEHEILPLLIGKGLPVMTYESHGYFIDIGVPEGLVSARSYFRQG